jgi:Ca2+-transporting ATPase
MIRELVLLLFVLFGLNFYLGKVLQKVRIPWIFTGLLVGAFFSIQGSWFANVFASEQFELLAKLGVLLLLFIIGFSIDTESIRRQGSFIFRSTIAIILGEAIVGTILMHAVFDLSWGISALVATSFATVGEVVLLPILEEFKMTKGKVGQTILGIGVLDDIIEVVVILILSIIVGAQTDTQSVVVFEHILLALFLIISPILLRYIGFIKQSWKYAMKEHLFVGTMMLFFFFVWLGLIIDAPELAAIAAGIAVRYFLPNDQIDLFETEIKTMAYGFFGPIFFLSVGYETDFSGFGSIIPLIVAITLITSITKIVITYFSTRKNIGAHGSIVAGVALTIRLSTSIIVIKLLYDNQIIPAEVFTVLIGTTILFKFINPPLIAYLIKRWDLARA